MSLTPISLAFWAMDDGSKHGSGLNLNTHNFSESEVRELMRILQIKFNLNCSIHSQRGYFRI